MSPQKTLTPTKSSSEKNRNILLFFMIICALGFIVSLGFFIRKISEVRHTWHIHLHNPLGIIFSGSRDPLSDSGVLDIEDIEVWMTFSYINFRFHLPPDFLREELSIDDKKYPNIPISRYVKKKKLDSTQFLRQVKDTIRTLPLRPTLPIPIQ